LAKGFGTTFRPETSGYLLLDLHHPNSLFGLIIVKWHLKIIHKGKYCGFVVIQSIQKIFGWALFLWPALLFANLGWSWWRVRKQALLGDDIIAKIEIIQLRFTQTRLGTFCKINRRFDFMQQIGEFRHQILQVTLAYDLQLTPMVLFAQAMLRFIKGKVRFLTIVARTATHFAD
jgi:hypothetical protein